MRRQDILVLLLPALLPALALGRENPPTLILKCRSATEALALAQDPLGLSLPVGSTVALALPCQDRAPESLRSILRVTLTKAVDLAPARRSLAALRPQWLEEEPGRATDLLPNDSRYAELWALPLISAPQAWDLHQGDGAVVLAVVDTGAELTHPDLAGALWSNTAELQGAPGVDDDGNGVVDDVHGADLLDSDGDPSAMPGDLSHGTHTAGTAACVTDNGAGVACAAWRASLMPVRAGHQSSISRGVEGLWYAAAMGADIVSCSWGGDGWSAYENEVVQAVRELGVLVVASAGNNGTELPHYPAAYEGVLAVAATTSQDLRMPGSQIGWWVDCCAPGQDILSTVTGAGYGMKSGTSMATPLVASVAALAASRYPADDGDRLRERVKAACTSIDALNPGLAGKLGSGRVNALNLLTQSPRALQMTQFLVGDADGDGVAEPGEALQLRVGVEALLGAFSGLTATCTVPGGEAQVSDGTIAYGSLGEGQQSLPADAFALTLSAGLEPGSQVRVHLSCTASGGFSQGLDLLISVAPTFADHDNSNLQLSLGSHGVQGYWDFEANQGVGNGLRWPAGSANHIYTGSLLLECQGQVAHAVSYLTGQPADLEVYPGGEIRRTEEGAELHSEAEFGAEGLPGLRVRQLGLSAQGMDWVLVRFQLRNTGSQTLTGLRPGLWLDLDVGGTWGNDTGGWNAPMGIGWQSQSGGPCLGLKLLSEAPSSFRLCNWDEWSGGAGLEDAELSAWLAGGFQQVQATVPDDWQCLLGAQAVDLPPGGQREVAFALVAGATAGELVVAADEAQVAWQSLELGTPAGPTGMELDLKVWPNPFNPASTWEVEMTSGQALRWRVVDVAGRQVAAGRIPGGVAGVRRQRLDFTGYPSGLYLLAVEHGGRQAVARLLLLR